MTPIPNALVTDLLSTGYFYKELKNYSETKKPEAKEIDLLSYSKEYALPYLMKVSETYDRSGHIHKRKILNFAIGCLADVNEGELVESIVALKKIAISEINLNEKALSGMVHLDKSARLCHLQKSESAQWLAKLLVSVIKMFKLVEIDLKADKYQKAQDPVGDTLKGNWVLFATPNA